jgi:hypothetical protein
MSEKYVVSIEVDARSAERSLDKFSTTIKKTTTNLAAMDKSARDVPGAL